MVTAVPTTFKFVDDLVHLILESHENWWPRDLVRLSLVWSAWLGPTQKRLFGCSNFQP